MLDGSIREHQSSVTAAVTDALRLFLDEVLILIREVRPAMRIDAIILPRFSVDDRSDRSGHNHGSRIVDEPLLRLR